MDDYSAIYAGTAQMFGSALNAYVSADINYDTRKWNEEQADKAWNRQMDLWNKTNLYNSPTEQMKRFEEAGLNKNLIYGQGSSGNASSMPTPPIPKWNPENPRWGDALTGALGVLNAYYDTRLKDVQIDNQKRIGKNLELQNIRQSIDNVIKRNEAQYYPLVTRAKVNLQNQGAKLSQKKMELTDKQVGLTEKQMSLAETQGEALDAEILLKGQELENKAIMNSILLNERDYGKFRQDYIRENKYAPESSPTLWRTIQDGINRLGSYYDTWDQYRNSRFFNK